MNTIELFYFPDAFRLTHEGSAADLSQCGTSASEHIASSGGAECTGHSSV